MPTYVYRCEECGHQFERRQPFTEPPIQDCPRCQHRVRRVHVPAAILFKGQGWYSTDSRAGRPTDKKTEGDA